MPDTVVVSENLPSLLLRRATLDRLPPLDVPADFVLRTAAESDLPAVGQVLGGAFPERDWSLERTCEHLWEDRTVRTVFLILHQPDAQVVATASARVLPEYPGAGYVHWVGVAPAFRGLQLGRLVTLATLHEFARLGLTAAVLETDDFRIPALHVYARLGFRPEIQHVSHAERWDALFALSPTLKTLMETDF